MVYERLVASLRCSILTAQQERKVMAYTAVTSAARNPTPGGKRAAPSTSRGAAKRPNEGDDGAAKDFSPSK
jgi:hypothetical protein